MRNKTIALSLLIVFQVFTIKNFQLSAQKIKSTDVPEDVMSTFDEQYSYMKVSGWQIENDNYVASVKDGSTNGKVYISKNGDWVRTIFYVPSRELPSSITDFVKNNYPDFIISVSCLEERENENTHYYLEVKKDGIGNKPSVLTFSSTGANKLLSRIDPDDFVDPTKEQPDKVSIAKAAAEERQAAKNEAAKKAAEEKAKAEAERIAAEKANKQTQTAQSATKQSQPQKTEKPKKEKPEPVVKDEHGNIAIKATSVPDVVSKALVKKVLHPAELNWFLVDSMYIAHCLNQGKKTVVYISPKGFWNKTLTIMPEESVTGLMSKHLNDFYPGWKFKNAVKEQRSDKNDKTMVEFYEKNNYKAKLITTVFFDKAGKLIRTIDPDYELGTSKQESSDDDALNKYYEKMNMSLENDNSKNIPDNIAATFKVKYPKVTNVEWEEDDNMNYLAKYYTTRGKEICVINRYGEIVETWLLGKNDNLSATIQDYLKKEYKNYKLKEFYTVKKIAEKITAYKVIVADKKSQTEEELWFNLSGKPIEM